MCAKPASSLSVRSFFERPVVDVARDLIGAHFAHGDAGGTIVETEAYGLDDPASHSFGGPRGRNAAMFGAPGDLYVYRIYGMHLCANIVCQPGHAVLLRALEPMQGVEAMSARRGGAGLRQLCSGPGKLCAALAITMDANGARVDAPPFRIALAHRARPVMAGPRIGISKAVDAPWRFGLEGSAFLSRPFR